jgi:hypothetical protein
VVGTVSFFLGNQPYASESFRRAGEKFTDFPGQASLSFQVFLCPKTIVRRKT